ncbi:MAG: hypothetical protein WC437_00695 [Patescibacteria group bacterium]|jgi:hypothetical protein|nr:hypothetical protein [Patescibacteria group bacterium]
MPSKVNTARICLLIEAWLYALLAVFFVVTFLLVSLGIGLSSQEGSGVGAVIFGSVGLFIAVVLAAFAVLMFLTAKGVKEKKNWAKIVGIVLAVLNLPNFPLGTIIGILILIGLLDEQAAVWFGPKE